MLGNFIYSDEVANTEYQHETPHKVEKALKRFLLFAAIFISGGVLWIFIISPITVPAKINISSFPGLDRAEVLYNAGINEGATYIAINAAEAQMRLSQHYLVESARVVKRFPDRISIFLEPRRPVAVALARINGRAQPVYLDRYGVVMRLGRGSTEMPSAWLPVVSGIFTGSQQPWLGMRLPQSLVPLFLRIGAIAEEDQHIWQAISEIHIAWRDNEQFDLILFPVNNSIRLRMGTDISKESIYYALLMADVSRRLGDFPSEIDVRSGIGVFRTQEARFGE